MHHKTYHEQKNITVRPKFTQKMKHISPDNAGHETPISNTAASLRTWNATRKCPGNEGSYS
jgi:hypothetical protein